MAEQKKDLFKYIEIERWDDGKIEIFDVRDYAWDVTFANKAEFIAKVIKPMLESARIDVSELQ